MLFLLAICTMLIDILCELPLCWFVSVGWLRLFQMFQIVWEIRLGWFECRLALKSIENQHSQISIEKALFQHHQQQPLIRCMVNLSIVTAIVSFINYLEWLCAWAFVCPSVCVCKKIYLHWGLCSCHQNDSDEQCLCDLDGTIVRNDRPSSVPSFIWEEG